MRRRRKKNPGLPTKIEDTEKLHSSKGYDEQAACPSTARQTRMKAKNWLLLKTSLETSPTTRR